MRVSISVALAGAIGVMIGACVTTGVHAASLQANYVICDGQTKAEPTANERIQACTAVIKSGPGGKHPAWFKIAFADRGAAKDSLGDHLGAVTDLLRARDLWTDDEIMMPILWIVHYRLAVAAYNASRYELAEASLENYVEVRSKLLQSDPNFGETVYNQVSDVFGDIYFAQSNFADAAKAYQRYLDADINSSVDSSKLDVVKDKLARAQQATTSGQGVPDGALPAPIDACEKFPQLCWQDSDA